MKKISKILIANRGEIAVRAIKTCKKLGIKTVAVYSDVDASFPFVRLSDENYHIGLPVAKDSYLNIDKIISVAKQSGADAVYPGYGFLSENAEFIASLNKEGIGFVGPNAQAVRAMGDKITSKNIAKKAGVNTIPGCQDVIKDANHAIKVANEIGYPVILKASAGGGGKGIRVVYHENEVARAFSSVTNEGEKFFGDCRIFIEKFIENPRHIEIQIIADKHGNIVCLGERECSIQRNNQKVLEEAPSSFVTPEVREEMYKQSIKLAKEVGYDSAGTLEFIMDANHNFYFLEMNTRLQVEHPVTEYITGLDLVEQMIYSAEGRKLEFTQEDIKLDGWAIESRICAEDPSKNFLPSIGRISIYITPKETESVRIDSGIREGLSITPYYDSMIAKLITYGKTREEARMKMIEALNQFIIDGLDNNITFLQSIYVNPKFISGDISTAFIKNEYKSGFTGTGELTPETTKLFGFASCIAHLENNRKLEGLSEKIFQTKQTRTAITNFIMFIDDARVSVKLLSQDGTRLHVEIDNQKYEFTYSYKIGSRLMKIYLDDLYYIKIKNKKSSFTLEYNGVKKEVILRNARTAALYEICVNNKTDSSFQKDFECPLTGLVVGVHVSEGDVVKSGTLLMTIEAMKMENAFYAEFDAVVEKILVKPTQTVNMGEVLLQFKPL
jgi:propionyl-CoA carboxylase alpha chain